MVFHSTAFLVSFMIGAFLTIMGTEVLILYLGVQKVRQRKPCVDIRTARPGQQEKVSKGMPILPTREG